MNDNRIADLELALDYALRLLVIFEPGDSRALSNVFVSMVAILCNVTNEESRQILRAAIAEDERILAEAGAQ